MGLIYNWKWWLFSLLGHGCGEELVLVRLQPLLPPLRFFRRLRLELLLEVLRQAIQSTKDDEEGHHLSLATTVC